jgi:cytoskeletal protein CcmA (bactofilin family)
MMTRQRQREGDHDSVQPTELGIKDSLGPETTVVGRGAEVDGTLVSAESIRIDGKARGKIAARGDVILSSNSHVEADIQAQNVVMGGTLKGNITARTKTELAPGGRLDGKIRSKVLVVREGALFFGQSTMDLDDAPSETDGSAYPEDQLRTAYEDAARRGADWYRSRLYGPKTPSDREPAEELDAPATSEPDWTVAR